MCTFKGVSVCLREHAGCCPPAGWQALPAALPPDVLRRVHECACRHIALASAARSQLVS